MVSQKLPGRVLAAVHGALDATRHGIFTRQEETFDLGAVRG